MKVRKEQQGPEFNPFNIILTVENEEEARALYAIFNYCPNLDLLPREENDNVRKTIGEKFGTSSGEIARGVTYRDFYRSKT